MADSLFYLLKSFKLKGLVNDMSLVEKQPKSMELPHHIDDHISISLDSNEECCDY